MEWVETTASTIEAAREDALDRLGIHEDDAEFEVLSEGRVGLFGRVKEVARVRARVRPTTPRFKDSRGRQRSRRSGPAGRNRAGAPRQSPEPGPGTQQDPGGGDPPASPQGSAGGPRRRSRGSRPPVLKPAQDHEPEHDEGRDTEMHETMRGLSLDEQVHLAEDFVRGLAERMSISLEFTRHDLDEGILRIDASGEDLGVLIGRRGMTAQAVDELVRTVLLRSGGTAREGKIRMDIGGVRARRNEALTKFTHEVAATARQSGENVAFEPMSSMDRKLVHDVVSDLPGVESCSEGEGMDRYVVVVPVSGDS